MARLFGLSLGTGFGLSLLLGFKFGSLVFGLTFRLSERLGLSCFSRGVLFGLFLGVLCCLFSRRFFLGRFALGFGLFKRRLFFGYAFGFKLFGAFFRG